MMAARRRYMRSTDGWWRRDPFFVRYMIREGSAVFLSAYALILLWGLAALAHGASAYEAWRATLAHPLSLLFHLAALALVSYHAYTWWKVSPKTIPTVRLRGREISQPAIAAGGWAATLAASLLVYGFIRWLS